MLHPLLVTRWDGAHVWLQWTPPPSGKTALRLRYRRPGAPDWTPWIDTNIPWPITATYLRLPIHKQNWAVEAEMAEWHADGAMTWEPAAPAKFLHCMAPFEFRSEKRWSFPAESIFLGVVDGDGTGWKLLAPVEIIPGQPWPVADMEAVQATGIHQLDWPGHLTAQPELGLFIRNTEPSRNDCEILPPGTVAVIEPANPDGPMVFVAGAVNRG